MAVLLNYDKVSGKVKVIADKWHITEDSNKWILFDGHLSKETIGTKILCEPQAASAENFCDPYIMFLYDKARCELSIYQHLFGGKTQLYFCSSATHYYFSDSLKTILLHYKLTPRLNTAMLPYYFYNGFLPAEHTLIQGIYKLPPLCTAFICRNNVKLLPVPRLTEKEPLFGEEAKEAYHEVISAAIKKCHPCTKEYSVALSGGYDSNCILSYLKAAEPEKAIHAFSVGGVSGIDETVTAQKIASVYDKVRFSSSLVDSHTLDYMDDIVLRLEGSVYERGIFLQYELAKLIAENNSQHVICGECADQIFNANLFKKPDDNIFFYDYEHTPLEMGSYIVLKKSTLMLRSFNIDGYYPFLVPSVMDLSQKIAQINHTTKEFHKQCCMERLDERIKPMIAKQGGSTSLLPLLEDTFSLVRKIHNSKFYTPDFMLLKHYTMDEALRDRYLSLLFLESFEKQFCYVLP